MLWGSGSVFPLDSARIADGKLILTRVHEVQSKDAAGKTVKSKITETITATRDGDRLQLVSVKPRAHREGRTRRSLRAGGSRRCRPRRTSQR